MGLVAPHPVLADDQGDLKDLLARQQQLRQQQADQATQLDVLQANDEQVTQAIDTLQGGVVGQQSKLVQANRRAVEAEAALDGAHQAEAAQEERLRTTEAAARQFALQAYISPSNELEAMFTADAGSMGYRAGLASLQGARFTDSLDELAAARADLETARAKAQQAADRAGRRKAEAAAQLQGLQQSLARQQGLSDKIEDRLDAALNEAASLEQVDATLSGQIRTQQDAIAARLAAARRAAEQTAAASGLSAPAPGGGRSVTSPVGAISVTSVGGITVAAKIAGQVAGLIAAAGAAGFHLGGGGYRSADAQVAVRRSNCGPSQYDIYQKPSSQCRPPAARPGSSMHERGEAIDFTCDGALITSRSSACFRWLAANAPRFGLLGNSREAWHWSTNGN